MRGTPLKTPERVELARELRDEGLSYQQIAARVGRAKGTVYQWLNPDKAAKRAWENTHDRGVCACGAVMAVGAKRHGYARCQECERSARRDAREARRAEIARLYREGMTHAAIGAELARTPAAVGVALAGMRADGWDLTYRRAGWKRKVPA